MTLNIFYIPTGHLYVFFGVMSFQVLDNFLIRLPVFFFFFSFLLLICRRFLYTLEINSLSSILFDFFFLSTVYLINLLNAYFAAQIFGLMFHLSTFAFVSCGLLLNSSNNF